MTPTRVSTAGDGRKGSSSRLLFHFAPPPGRVSSAPGFNFCSFHAHFWSVALKKGAESPPQKKKKKLLTVTVMDVKLTDGNTFADQLFDASLVSVKFH